MGDSCVLAGVSCVGEALGGGGVDVGEVSVGAGAHEMSISSNIRQHTGTLSLALEFIYTSPSCYGWTCQAPSIFRISRMLVSGGFFVTCTVA